MQDSAIIKARLLSASDLDRTLDRMARQIVELIDPADEDDGLLALIGMQTRGVHIARRIREKIHAAEGMSLQVGVLDTNMYRDDFRTRMHLPRIRVTDIPFDVSGRHLVLIDDVLYTGRTARAALDAITDLGRPASVTFLVIIDRGHRELPICADVVGRFVPTTPGEEVRVTLSELDEEDGVWLVDEPEETG
jgi:pyrimidine operon attenuation protein/uracil phosphoribosyltransferase